MKNNWKVFASLLALAILLVGVGFCFITHRRTLLNGQQAPGQQSGGGRKAISAGQKSVDDSLMLPPLITWIPITEANTKAQKSGKPIMFFFTTTGCQPCKEMEKEFFGDPKIAGQINESYVPVFVPDPQDYKDGSPEAAIAQRFHTFAFPAIYICKPSGKTYDYRVGYLKPDHALEFLKTSKQRMRIK